MKKMLIILLVAVLVLSAVGCSQTPPNVPDVPNVPDDTNDTDDTDVQNVPIVPDDTDNQAEPSGTEGQLLDGENYEEFLADIYLCIGDMKLNLESVWSESREASELEWLRKCDGEGRMAPQIVLPDAAYERFMALDAVQQARAALKCLENESR